MGPSARDPQQTPVRYAAVAGALYRVLFLNLAVAGTKVVLGYVTGAVSILSDGFHSLTDCASNVMALMAVRIAQKPPDLDHPYGHRKYETLAAAGIVILLLLLLVELLRAVVGRLESPVVPHVTAATFAILLATLAVNAFVVTYERRAARRLNSEILFADALHTQSDLLTTLAVLGAMVGVWLGWPWLDPAAAVVIAFFIGKAGYDIARDTSRILADRFVIAQDDIERVVMDVPGILGCHHIRTRGSADHTFLDLHVWLRPETRLDTAHQISHVVKDRLMTRFPQIVDAIIHIEPPPTD